MPSMVSTCTITDFAWLTQFRSQFLLSLFYAFLQKSKDRPILVNGAIPSISLMIIIKGDMHFFSIVAIGL